MLITVDDADLLIVQSAIVEAEGKKEAEHAKSYVF